MKHFKTMVNPSAVSLNMPVSRCFYLVKQLGCKSIPESNQNKKKLISDCLGSIFAIMYFIVNSVTSPLLSQLIAVLLFLPFYWYSFVSTSF